MKVEILLMLSQEPATCRLHQIGQAKPCRRIYWRSICSHLCLDFLSGLLPSYFPIKTLYASLHAPTRDARPAPLILLHFITFMRNAGYEAPHHAVFSTPLLPRRSQAHISPQHPILENPQAMFLRPCKRQQAELTQLSVFYTPVCLKCQ